MRDLLKADLKRVVKDKLFMVLGIIALVFAVTTPLINKALFALIGIEDIDGMEMLTMGMSAKAMFFSAFSPSNNFGLILPILVVIILCKDFGQGTMRNKIICGKSRTSIYFSLFITCFILICGFILAQALLTLLISLLLFDYQATAFTLKDFGYLMASIGFEFIVYLFICALLTFLIVFMKNAGLAIVLYFVTNFILMIVGAISQTAIVFVEPNSLIYELLEFFNTANVFLSTAIGNGTSYQLKEVVSLLLPNLSLSALFLFLGLSIFKKKDLK